jgi:hypothetical protein
MHPMRTAGVITFSLPMPHPVAVLAGKRMVAPVLAQQ